MVGVCSPFSGSSGIFYGDEEFVKNTTNSGNSCAYDANGNRLYDSNSNIWGINYNLLNLPDAMQFYQGHQTIYTYSATGEKLKVVDKTAPEGVILPVTSLNTVLSNPSVSTITTTDYVGNVIYENGTLKRILTPEGYWQDGTYYYFLKDHLGSNRVVINNSGGIAETSSYYPSGMRFGESAVNGGSVQPYRHTGHEMQSMHGLNWIDNEARFRTVNDGGGLPTVDPHAEMYYNISPYAYCGGNPVNSIDPDGMDYWFTNDPSAILRFMNSMNPLGSELPREIFNYSGWKHATDAQFTSKLTYNDENQTFYSSYGTVENGESVIHGIKIKAASFGDGSASIQTVKGKWYDKSSGAIKQENVEFALLVGGSKVGLSALSWLWNNVINPPAPSSINTFSANAGKSFRPGKQNSRDANLKQFPKDFQRWFHRFGKENGNFNATTQELREMFDEWIKMGRPQTK